LLPSDLWVMAAGAAVGLGLVILFWEEFKLLTFDPGFARSLGWPVRPLEGLLARMVGLAGVVGLRAVGVVLPVDRVDAPGAVGLGLVILFWKEFKLLTFDPGFARSLGWPVRLLEGLLTSMIALAVVVGLQMVGVVLMVAMIIAPATAARQWARRLETMVILA